MSEQRERSRGICFFDNQHIEMVQDVTRAWHRPQRAFDKPLLVGDKPWEHMPFLECTNWTVLFDEQDGLFRCWYEDWFINPRKLAELKVDITDPRVSFSYVLYAQSRDGLHWDKPLVGFDRDGRKTNIVLGDGRYGPDDFGSVHAATVLIDPVDPDPGKRFKMIFQHITMHSPYADARTDGFGSPQILQSPIRLAASPDGVHWTVDERELQFGPCGPKLGDVIAISYDTRMRKYVLCTRHCDAWRAEVNPNNPRTPAWSLPYYPHDPAKMNKRRIFETESDDLIHWSEPRLLLMADDEEDELDDSFYGMRRMETATGYVGLLNAYHSVDNRIDIQLVYSRDGKRWRRLNKRQPLFVAGPQGAWDDHNVHMSNPILEVDGQWWVYYSGAKESRWITGLMEGIDVQIPSHSQQRCWYGLGLAKLRREGFVSLRSDALREGLFITRPLQRAGRQLVINARCVSRAAGHIDVEVVTDDDKLLPSLSRGCFDRFTGDDTQHLCTWQGKADLGDAAMIKLRFWMLGAELYSISFHG